MGAPWPNVMGDIKLSIPVAAFRKYLARPWAAEFNQNGERGGIAMKAMFAAVSALICLAGYAQAAALQACNLTVDVVDTDPKGTNVREAPGGKFIAVLKTSPDPLAADWIEAHVIGQSGDWFLIDGAKDVGDNEKTIFRGEGYLHRSVLGASGLWNGSALWSDHDEKSPLVAKETAGDQTVLFLGCWGHFAKVHVTEGTGWTKSLCLNNRTTCA